MYGEIFKKIIRRINEKFTIKVPKKSQEPLLLITYDNEVISYSVDCPEKLLTRSLVVLLSSDDGDLRKIFRDAMSISTDYYFNELKENCKFEEELDGLLRDLKIEYPITEE